MYFVNYFIARLAEYYALPIAEKIEYEEVLHRRANKLQAKAAYLDAQAQPNVPMQDNPFIDVRYGGRR